MSDCRKENFSIFRALFFLDDVYFFLGLVYKFGRRFTIIDFAQDNCFVVDIVSAVSAFHPTAKTAAADKYRLPAI